MSLPKRIRINGVLLGIRLFVYNLLVILADNEENCKRLYEKKHNLDMQFVSSLARGTIRMTETTSCQLTKDYRIYVLWWQGEEAMPEIIHATINSIKAATNKEVVLVTLDNVKNLIEIPEYIWMKYKRGMMGPAHFSDYARMALIDRYGGLWIDSTVLCTKKIPDWISDMDLFTIKAVENTTESLDEKYVAKGRWNTQVLGSNKIGHPFFRNIKLIMEAYWKQYDYMIDYLMFDDFILYMYLYNREVKIALDAVPVSNLQMHSLLPLLNDRFNEYKWARLISDTEMFKLTYKGKFKEFTDCQETFYNYIIRKWKGEPNG